MNKNLYPYYKNIVKFREQPNSWAIFIKSENQIIKQELNDSAFNMLKLIDGESTLENLITKLSLLYKEEISIVEKFVIEFLTECNQIGLVYFNSEKINMIKGKIYGNSQFWTPDFINIEITQHCLLNCKHCYLGEKNNSEMKFENLKKILLKCINSGLEKVQLTGGEPLLYKDINELIRLLNDYNITTIITSSGFIPKSKQISIISTLKLIIKNKGYIQISLDGLKKDHNNLRNNNKAFQTTINFIKLLQKNEIPFGLSCVIHQDNYKNIHKYIKYIKTLNPMYLKMSGIVDISNNPNLTKKINPTKIVEIIKELKIKYENNNFKILYENEFSKENEINCGIGTTQITLSSKFEVLPCVMLRKSLGNCKITNIFDILKNYSHLFYKLEAPSTNYCSSCNEFKFCSGCIALGLLNNKKSCNWLLRSNYENIFKKIFNN